MVLGSGKQDNCRKDENRETVFCHDIWRHVCFPLRRVAGRHPGWQSREAARRPFGSLLSVGQTGAGFTAGCSSAVQPSLFLSLAFRAPLVNSAGGWFQRRIFP